MSTTKPVKTEQDAVLTTVNELAEYMYEQAQAFPEDEKWQSAHKLRSTACDLLFFVAQGTGSASQAATGYEWANARKHAVTLKTMYRFACRQKFIALEPEIMVRLDRLTKDIDTRLDEAAKALKKQEEDDLKPWLKKYDLWRKINETKR